MVEVFREVRRVLKNEGTCWMNLGDSYAAGGNGGHVKGEYFHGHTRRGGDFTGKAKKSPKGLKPKDLVGIPWRVALALQAPYTDWQIKTEAMRAWVAGIVDGEGCITIIKTKSSHSESLSFPPIVQVRMCDREPLDRLVDVVGSKIGKAQMPPSHYANHQRESWQWKVVSEQAATVISEIYPYLTCKRRQAIVAWNHQQFRSNRGNQKRARGALEKEQLCKKLINDLNQRKEVDLPSWMIEPIKKSEPGWYLRQDCIWSKPNPMPESATDRCTKAHEYLFLLTKRAKYYFDADAIAEPCVESNASRPRMGQGPNTQYAQKRAGKHRQTDKQAAGHRIVENVAKARSNGAPHDNPFGETHNKRSVWQIPTQPYPDAHFATMPEKLVEPCIRAGCPEWVCNACGQPRVRITQKQFKPQPDVRDPEKLKRDPDALDPASSWGGSPRGSNITQTTGWTDCGCGQGFRPGIVLDPFMGAGTVGLVAYKNNRHYIGIELNPEYITMAKKRIAKEREKYALIE